MPRCRRRSAASRRAWPAGGCSAGRRTAGGCGGAEARAGRAQGPADEGGADAGHHPRRAAEGICRRACPAAGQRAADGLALRQAPHDHRARAGLAGPASRASSTRPRPPPRSARSTRRPPRTGRELACKLQYPDMASAVEADLQQLRLFFDVFQRYDKASTRPRSTPRSRSGCARSWTTIANAAHGALRPRCSARRSGSISRKACRSFRPGGSSP